MDILNYMNIDIFASIILNEKILYFKRDPTNTNYLYRLPIRNYIKKCLQTSRPPISFRQMPCIISGAVYDEVRWLIKEIQRLHTKNVTYFNTTLILVNPNIKMLPSTKTDTIIKKIYQYSNKNTYIKYTDYHRLIKGINYALTQIIEIAWMICYHTSRMTLKAYDIFLSWNIYKILCYEI